MVAPVIADTGFIVRLPHSLYQMSWRTSVDERDVEAGVRQQLGDGAATRVARAAARLADDQPLPHPVLHQAGLGRSTRWRARRSRARASNGIAAAIARPGRRSRSGAPGKPGTPWPNHQGTPFIAGSTTVSRPEQRRDAARDAGQRRALDGDDHQVLRARARPHRRWPAPAPARSPAPVAGASRAARSAASVAPRASALTSTRPAAASRVPMKPPIAPAPTMQTFSRMGPPREAAGSRSMPRGDGTSRKPPGAPRLLRLPPHPRLAGRP